VSDSNQTMTQHFMATAERVPDQGALVDRGPDGVWRVTTWGQYRDRASALAMGLRGLGVEHGDVVAIMCGNRPEHVIADVGAMMAGATPVSIYNTLTSDQIAYVAGDAAAKVAIVEHADYLATWSAIRDQLPALEHVVLIEGDAPEGVLTWAEVLADGAQRMADDPAAFEQSWQSVGPDDPATVIYTSGTTGPPKGVVITHGNLSWIVNSLATALDLHPSDEGPQRGLSYLPLAHIAERLTSHYMALSTGLTVYFAREIGQVREVLLEARPNIFMAVPRVWEKFHAAMLTALDDEKASRRKLVLHAIRTGAAVAEHRRAGSTAPLGLRAQHAVFDRVILSKLRGRLGLDQLRFAVSGAAPISDDLLAFFAGMGVEILEVYGMTETTAIISCNLPGAIRHGTVGRSLPGAEMRIADDGEVMARGPHITPGYLNRPDATAETLADDGWLLTGDLGSIDVDGYLRITGRKKELIITAGGKNLSPNNIEESIKQQSTIIGQMCAVGDRQPFIGALIVLDPEATPAWASHHGLDETDVARLAQHPVIIEEVTRAVAAGNEKLARVEQVREFRILGNEWTPESGEVTPSLKVKRSVVHEKYADLIGSIYGS